MSLNVSIILISYNLYPQNLFTLYSLQNQVYEQNKMEVILVDDCSTDNTNSLKDFTAPFTFKYVRTAKNLGRAGAKNVGLKAAEGEIIIFLDGEIMVDPYFVVNHVRHYGEKAQIAVSGTSGTFSTYSVLQPSFNHKQLRQFHSIVSREPVLFKTLAQKLNIPLKYINDFKNFLNYVSKNDQNVPLLSKEIIDTKGYKRVSVPAPSFPRVLKHLNGDLSDYHLAWTFFITRNVSTRKELLYSVGPFNEDFKGWGYEDWELGYRLYKRGVKFIEDGEIICYHQEHPISKTDRKKDQMQNYSIFMKLHPEIEVCTIVLNLLGKRKFLQINSIVKDYYALKEEFPNQYLLFITTFIKLTQQIPLLISKGNPATNLLSQIGYEKDTSKKEKLFYEAEELRENGKYSNLIKAFDLLLKL